jgi:hypothetical protein
MGGERGRGALRVLIAGERQAVRLAPGGPTHAPSWSMCRAGPRVHAPLIVALAANRARAEGCRPRPGESTGRSGSIRMRVSRMKEIRQWPSAARRYSSCSCRNRAAVTGSDRNVRGCRAPFRVGAPKSGQRRRLNFEGSRSTFSRGHRWLDLRCLPWGRSSASTAFHALTRRN